VTGTYTSVCGEVDIEVDIKPTPSNEGCVALYINVLVQSAMALVVVHCIGEAME